MQESSWDKVRYSLWTWWVVITAIYLLIPLLFGPLSSLASLIIRTIGLFVPIAQLSLMGIFIYYIIMSWLYFVVGVGCGCEG